MIYNLTIYDFTIEIRVEVRVRENVIERVPSIVNRKLSNHPSFLILSIVNL